MTQPSPSIPRYRAPVGSSTTARAGVGGAPAVLHKEDWEEMGSRIQFLDSPTGFKWIQVEPEAPVPDAAEGLTLLAEPVPHETKPESRRGARRSSGNFMSCAIMESSR